MTQGFSPGFTVKGGGERQGEEGEKRGLHLARASPFETLLPTPTHQYRAAFPTRICKGTAQGSMLHAPDSNFMPPRQLALLEPSL